MHKNARLTPRGREVMLGRLQAGQHQADVAQAMAISLTTLKWRRRFRDEDLGGLQDRSSRPRCSPQRLPPRLVERVVALRRKLRTGRYIAVNWDSPQPASRASCGACICLAGVSSSRLRQISLSLNGAF